MMLFGCKHKWEVKVDHLAPSPAIQIIEAGQDIANAKGSAVIGTHITIMACTKCGKIYKSVEET